MNSRRDKEDVGKNRSQFGVETGKKRAEMDLTRVARSNSTCNSSSVEC